MSEPDKFSLKAYTGPRYWPTWVGICLMYISAWLPHRIRILSGSALGYLTWLFARERRYITATNIRMCFPDLAAEEQQRLVRQCFQSNGIGILETAVAWFRHPRYLKSLVTFPNPEILLDAVSEGRGVLLLGAHYSMLDLGGSFQGMISPYAATYRPHNNPLFDQFIVRGRKRNGSELFDRDDIRHMFRHLKQGKVLWYAPDQDYGELHSVYAPFFGNAAATITTPSRFAKINNSPTIILRYRRRADNRGYITDYERVPDNWPQGDDIHDAAQINTLIEKAIRLAPEQYMWMHKRFKTQPGGKPESPYIFIKTPVSRLQSQRLQEMLEVEGVRINTLPTETRTALYLQRNGMYLRLMQGDVHKWPKLGSAHRMDHLSKYLRHVGIPGLTINRWFRLPGRKQYGLLCHLPGESSLKQVLNSGQQIDWAALGAFLLTCHDHGVNLEQADPLTLGLNDKGYFLVYLEDVQLHPFSLCNQDRAENMQHFLKVLGDHPAVTEAHLDQITAGYLENCSPAISRDMCRDMASSID